MYCYLALVRTFWVAILLSLSSCFSAQLSKKLRQTESEFQNHTGLYIYDIATKKTLIEYNADKYFTPASNTKILTLYGALSILGDSLPSLYYIENEDSLVFWGSGDPSLLNELLPQSEVYSFLQSEEKQLFYSDANFHDTSLGPGWAWDDYAYRFSAERTPLPLFGNTLELQKSHDSDYPSINSGAFKPLFYLSDSSDKTAVLRQYGTNQFYYQPGGSTLEKSIPYKYEAQLIASLLTDTLKKEVNTIKSALPKDRKALYHPAPDSIYRIMMQNSDNLMAEQLLLTISGVISDTLNTQIAIDHIIEQYFQNAPDQPIWRDGSGLSRYNLFTPKFLVWLWTELLKQYGEEYLFSLIAAGGESGTLRNYYKSTTPYIFGKTGTLSNNHNLSGFIRTRKGKLLAFSFMNNNYPTSSAPIKKRMEQILYEVHLNY